jgi:hypothetical protein
MTTKLPPLKKGLIDHGAAVFNGSAQSHRATRDPVNGRDYVYVGLNCTPALIIQIDVLTGKSKQFDLPAGCSSPWSIAFTLDGDLLVTTVGNGSIVRINPRTGKMRVVAVVKAWPWHIDRGPDGLFYIATSPSAQIFRFDAVTEKLEELVNYKHLDNYARVVYPQNDGYIYTSIGCVKSQVVAYNMATGKSESILPKNEIGPDFHGVGRGLDGQVYAYTSTNKNSYRLAGGQAYRVDKPNGSEIHAGHPWGQFALPRLPDGRAVRKLDPDAVEIGDEKSSKIISYAGYKTAGTGIFHLAEGPNETVVASTIMPLYILRYTPKTKKLENLGRGAPDNGEAYSFSHCDGKLYYGCYSLGSFMMYDPAKPWNKDKPGQMKWESNPKYISNLGKGHNRPRAQCVDSKKRIWVAGMPEYGQRSSGLFSYDTISGKTHNTPVVIEDRSIMSLVGDTNQDVVYGGMDVNRGTGVAPAKGDAVIFAWDGAKQKMLWKKAPVAGENGIINLLFRDGKLYGTSRMKFTFFCFDVATRKTIYATPSTISACREQSMCWGPDGNIYGITYTTLFRWIPQTGVIENIYHQTAEEAAKETSGSLFHRGAVIIDKRLYFSCGSHVMSLPLPL